MYSSRSTHLSTPPECGSFPKRTRRRRTAWLHLALLVLLGCATRSEIAPLYREEPLSSPERSQLIVYRLDRVRSSGKAKLRLDGEVIGRLANGEYLALELDPGPHELGVRFRELFWSFGWGTSRFETRPGQRRFLRLSASPEHQPSRADVMEEGYGGQRAERYSVNLFRAWPSEDEALREVVETRRGG